MKQDVFPARQGARKRRSQWLAFGIFKLLSYSIVLILFAILGFIIYKGIGVIIRIKRTSLPFGAYSFIVFGLFGMALFVKYMGFGDSILAGSLTLGLLCVPLVIRTTEEALKAIPDSFREGSLALGATKLQTIWHVILPMGMPNIITGLILALGRVSGETAPILFTCAAYFLPQLPHSILDQCMALPYHLYVISTSGTDMESQLPLAYGTALVLIIIILIINLLANALRRYFSNKVKTN